ncbi:MAG: CocE/NonD family hydrolase [Acidobacteriota bacterium]
MISKPKLLSLLVLFALLVGPCLPRASNASAGLLVEESTHFIEVPGGSFGAQPLKLAASLYQPRFFPSAPAVIYIHGWGGRRLKGEDNIAYYVAAAGYTVLSYTARGFGEGESGGRATLAGPDELNDLSRIIDWLINDPDQVIGPRVTKIGVIGGSYGGSHSFQIASDPRVSAVVPLAGWTDLEQALFPNGTINYRAGIAHFYSGLEQQTGQAPFFNYTQLQFDIFDVGAEGRSADDSVKQQLRARSIAQKNEDGQEILDPARQPRAPMYIIQSWDDYLFPSTQVVDVFAQTTAPKQIYLGRQGHPPEGHTFEGEELYIATQVLRWFERYLRGFGPKDSRSVTSAPAPFSVLPFTAKQFPSDNISSDTLFLKPSGVLKNNKKGSDQPETAGGVFRPERIRSSRRGAEIPTQSDMLSGRAEALLTAPQKLVYTLTPWDRQTEMVGSSEFTFYVSSATSTDLDLLVRTFDVAPDGTETEVTIGATRVTGLSPAEVRRVTFRDYGDDWVFEAGHSLRIKVSNIDFPSFRPPGANDNLPSEITIHNGKAFPSKMKLPVRVR